MEKIVVRQLFRNLDRYANQVVELNGWVRNNRAQKSFGFLREPYRIYFYDAKILKGLLEYHFFL